MADCASLERMCTGNGTEGSNPSLSAMFPEMRTRDVGIKLDAQMLVSHVFVILL